VPFFYLPFFSNCQPYGKNIPIFSVFEQHRNCELVDKEKTEFIWQYGFGETATADTCSEVVLDCIFDDFSNQPSEKPYWF